MVQKQVISFPIPLYSNPPIEPQFYQPNQFFISAITLGQTTMVTTTTDCNYVIGQLVRFIIPQYNGTRQLNEQTGYVIDLPASNQITVKIDSSSYDLFQTSMQPTQPQILAIGNIASGNINGSGNVNLGTFIPGSFINISPL